MLRHILLIASDIFYVVINLSARSKSYIITYISLINSVLMRIKCLQSIESVEDESIAGCVKILKLQV